MPHEVSPRKSRKKPRLSSERKANGGDRMRHNDHVAQSIKEIIESSTKMRCR